MDNVSGLLIMPSADMDESGTFKITNCYLNKNYLPFNQYYAESSAYWGYDTFGYGFSITFWSRLEVAYSCTILNGDWSPYANTYRAKIMKNQDRHFSAKVLALKEGEIWSWTPSVAFGVSDPITSGGSEGYVESGEAGNGFFNRFYAVAAKHFNTSVGQVGTHLGYQYTRRTDFLASGPIAAVDWQPIWIQNRWFSPKFVLEYDAKNVNFGFISSIWDDRFEAMFVLQGFQWVSCGLRYKLRLSGSEK